MNRRLLASLVPAALLLAAPAHADIYAYTDGNGVKHLSNVPSDPRYKLVMRTPAYSKAAAQPASYAPQNLYSPGGAAFASRNYYARNLGRAGRASRVNEGNRQRFTADINRIAAQYRLEPALMHAVISAESAYNPWAISSKGAMGLMQLMPGTAERFGVNNPYDPIANMHGGARYLRWLLDRFNDPRLAVAAYNAGEGAVQKYGNQVPPYRETQNYVVKVLDYYQRYRPGGGVYTAGVGGSPLAMNGYTAVSYYPDVNRYPTTGRGVTVIVPRTFSDGQRPAGGIATRSIPSAGITGNRATNSTNMVTYLTPTGTRVIISGSNSGGSGTAGVSRPPVRVNSSPARTALPTNTIQFAGNDK